MNPRLRGETRYRSLQASRRALAWSAPLVRYGLFSVGLAMFLDQVRPLVSDGQFTWGERRVMGAVGLVTLGGFAVAGWLAGRLLRASAELIEVVVDGSEATLRVAELMETQLLPTLKRSAESLERLAGSTAGGHAPPSTAEALREAIRQGRFGRAERLHQALLRDYPGHPEAARLAAELESALRTEVTDLKQRLSAARAADDLGKVVDCRDALTRHLRGDALHNLDRETARWALEHVRGALSLSEIPVRLVDDATRAAESLGDTPDGAALARCLPALRQRAGLCPDCGDPPHAPSTACPAARRPTNPSSLRPRRGSTIPEEPR